jgi:hypothetical protein
MCWTFDITMIFTNYHDLRYNVCLVVFRSSSATSTQAIQALGSSLSCIAIVYEYKLTCGFESSAATCVWIACSKILTAGWCCRHYFPSFIIYLNNNLYFYSTVCACSWIPSAANPDPGHLVLCYLIFWFSSNVSSQHIVELMDSSY